MSVFNLVLMGVSICKTYRTIAAMRRIRHSNTHIYIYMPVGGFNPSEKISVSWDNYSQCMENKKKVFQTTNQYVIIVVVVVNVVVVVVINIVPSYSPCFCPYIM